MQFMLMCCFDEVRWNALPEGDRDSIMRDYGQWVDERIADGSYLVGGKLQASTTAKTVHRRNGTTHVTDGPFSEAREQIGGYHVIACDSHEAAIALAQEIPTLPVGGTVEVRPLLRALGRTDVDGSSGASSPGNKKAR